MINDAIKAMEQSMTRESIDRSDLLFQIEKLKIDHAAEMRDVLEFLEMWSDGDCRLLDKYRHYLEDK